MTRKTFLMALFVVALLGCRSEQAKQAAPLCDKFRIYYMAKDNLYVVREKKDGNYRFGYFIYNFKGKFFNNRIETPTQYVYEQGPYPSLEEAVKWEENNFRPNARIILKDLRWKYGGLVVDSHIKDSALVICE